MQMLFWHLNARGGRSLGRNFTCCNHMAFFSPNAELGPSVYCITQQRNLFYLLYTPGQARPAQPARPGQPEANKQSSTTTLRIYLNKLVRIFFFLSFRLVMFMERMNEVDKRILWRVEFPNFFENDSRTTTEQRAKKKKNINNKNNTRRQHETVDRKLVC